MPVKGQCPSAREKPMIRLIIIDDEILARIGIQALLEDKEDISVLNTFSSPVAALEYLKKVRQVDIIITDIEMPDMDGLAFLKEVKENRFAKGVLIVSCHDNFSYAREAMKWGADDYILKQEISEEKLMESIEKIQAEKILPEFAEKKENKNRELIHQEHMDDVYYAVGVLKVQYKADREDFINPALIDKSMIIHLCENIVANERMGTFFSPYDKEMFILFQLSKELSKEDRTACLKKQCAALERNVRMFINDPLIIGCSDFFEDLKEVRANYQTGCELIEQIFYEEKHIFYSVDMTEPVQKPSFVVSGVNFLEGDWITNFQNSLAEYLNACSQKFIRVRNVKQEIFDKVNQLLYELARQYSLSGKVILGYVSKIDRVRNAERRSQLENLLLEQLSRLQNELSEHYSSNHMEKVLQYIENHIQEQISLPDAAAQCYMSVPYFCKKFKEYTGETYITYVNIRKAEKIKEYLKNDHMNLVEISNRMNFGNVNYMTRLFKNVTGMTIREYKNTIR